MKDILNEYDKLYKLSSLCYIAGTSLGYQAICAYVCKNSMNKNIYNNTFSLERFYQFDNEEFLTQMEKALWYTQRHQFDNYYYTQYRKIRYQYDKKNKNVNPNTKKTQRNYTKLKNKNYLDTLYLQLDLESVNTSSSATASVPVIVQMAAVVQTPVALRPLERYLDQAWQNVTNKQGKHSMVFLMTMILK